MSIDCTIYDLTTGEPTPMSLSNETLMLYAEKDVGFIFDVLGHPETHYVDLTVEPHVLVEYTAAELAEKAKVVSGWKWQMPQRVAVDLRSLSDLKLAKNAQINAARLAASRTSFIFNGKAIACDELSRSDIDGINGTVSLNQAMPSNWVGGWKAMDNTYVSIPDVATWKLFYGAMVDKGTANFAHAQQLKGRLATASSAAEVAAITWEQT